MLRIIIEENDCNPVVHANSKPVFSYKTFDVELPEVEKYLAEAKNGRNYSYRNVIGIEVIEEKL